MTDVFDQASAPAIDTVSGGTIDCDIAIIGSGMGGGTLAHVIRGSARVLVVERGGSGREPARPRWPWERRSTTGSSPNYATCRRTTGHDPPTEPDWDVRAMASHVLAMAVHDRAAVVSTPADTLSTPTWIHRRLSTQRCLPGLLTKPQSVDVDRSCGRNRRGDVTRALAPGHRLDAPLASLPKVGAACRAARGPGWRRPSPIGEHGRSCSADWWECCAR